MQLDGLVKARDRLRDLAYNRYWRRWAKSVSTFAYEAGDSEEGEPWSPRPIYTVDEHDPVERKPFPEEDWRGDIKWYWDDVIDGEELDEVIDKSRQNMISHGQRTAELQRVLFRPNFKIALVFDDKGEAEDHIENRVKFMYENTAGWLRNRYEIAKSKGEFIVERYRGRAWNSRIIPVPRDPDMLRGMTFSWIVWEEMAKQAWAERQMQAVRPTIRGVRDFKTGEIKKGRSFAISTPKPYAYHGRIIGDEATRDMAIAIAKGELEVPGAERGAGAGLP